MDFKIVEYAITAILGVFASSGFWLWIDRRTTRKSSVEEMVLGILQTTILERGQYYIHRGYITQMEYNNFVNYLYKPYKNKGGNGFADKIMKDIDNLPIHNPHTLYKGENDERNTKD